MLQPSHTNTSRPNPSLVLNAWASRMLRPRSDSALVSWDSSLGLSLEAIVISWNSRGSSSSCSTSDRGQGTGLAQSSRCFLAFSVSLARA